MIKIGSSPFHVAKARANNSKSPTMQQINAMVNASSMVEVENIIQQTGYGDLLEEVRPSVDLSKFEVAMKREYAALLHLYQRTAPKELNELLRGYALLIEAENMNLILQAILRQNVSEDLKNSIIPVGKYGMRHYERMMSSSSAIIATDFIIDPVLRKAAQKALNMSTDPDVQIYHLSSAMSHTTFMFLNQLVPNWIKKEIEIMNIETVCRGINLGIDPTAWMIPNNGVVHRYSRVLSSMKNPRDVLTYMLPHFPVKPILELALKAERDEDVIPILEDNALAYLHARHYRNFLIYGNRGEAILDFFAIKKAMVDDLGRILFSKLKAIPSDVVLSMLFPIYRR